MVFENKAKGLQYEIYPTTQDKVLKRIDLHTGLAEEINKIIAVVNNDSVVKINNGILGTLAFMCLIEKLENLSESDAINYLKTESLKL